LIDRATPVPYENGDTRDVRVKFGPFANPDGTPLRPNSASSVVSLLFRRLGLPKGASLHSLRHSHGSHLLADGVPLPVVSERLGHSSVRTTAEVYARRSEAKTMRQPCAGMNFSVERPRIGWKEDLSDG
jgi:integrase